jgi:hypothetical protein
MKLFSPGQDPTIRAQVEPLRKALQVTLLRMRIGIFLLNQPFQCLGQQARDRSMAFDGKQLDLEQDLFGK